MIMYIQHHSRLTISLNHKGLPDASLLQANTKKLESLEKAEKEVWRSVVLTEWEKHVYLLKMKRFVCSVFLELM